MGSPLSQDWVVHCERAYVRAMRRMLVVRAGWALAIFAVGMTTGVLAVVL